jgi:dienelactone hydrolase
MKLATILLTMLVVAAVPLHAAITTEPVEYKSGDATLKGFVVYDDATTEKRPGVLVVHEWWGLNDYAKMRAEMLAKAGYVALALDMYGDGKTTEHPQEAGEWAGAIGKNQELARGRFMAAYDLLRARPQTDPDRIAAIGYCFGGSVVLNMALGGADLDAVVSFHGGLPQTPFEADVKAKILVCHGGADALTTQEQFDTFEKNLAATNADWEINIYGGAKHSFTNPTADAHGVPQLAYNEHADKRSWQAMLAFLEEAFE